LLLLTRPFVPHRLAR